VTDITSLFNQLDAFKLAPVEKWEPDVEVDIDIRIASNGEWLYQGSRIDRHRIVKLFSTVLRLEGKGYFLVTPPVKYRVQVDDAPFNAVELNRQGQGKMQNLFFRTNMDEVVLADSAHPITVKTDPQSNEPAPYITVRSNLKAKILRPIFYELADLLQPDPDKDAARNSVGVFSAGQYFQFGKV
jgi:hypothetical protein